MSLSFANRRLVFLLLLTSSLLLPGCGDFERNAYRTLKVAKVEYELLQEHAARAYLEGRLTEPQWERFAVAGNRFIAAHTLAADLMKTYQQVRRAGSSEDERARLEARINAALAQLPVLLADLRALLGSFDSGGAAAADESRQSRR
ncbi:MAG TPA: hypothetical protein VNN18_06935 [Candidatus Xenobia bacterium]|nr:hypothetical protein [Candidatus Xenobia bacterium]